MGWLGYDCKSSRRHCVASRGNHGGAIFFINVGGAVTAAMEKSTAIHHPQHTGVEGIVLVQRSDRAPDEALPSRVDMELARKVVVHVPGMLMSL